jgi:hypothetical protein
MGRSIGSEVFAADLSGMRDLFALALMLRC